MALYPRDVIHDLIHIESDLYEKVYLQLRGWGVKDLEAEADLIVKRIQKLQVDIREWSRIRK